MGTKIGIGVIGGMGRGPAVGRLFNLTARAEVRAVADINPASFDVGRERFEAGGARPELYTSVAEMLRRDDLDWVVVGTPDRTHFALARQVIEAGKDVFVEKPMTQTLAESDALCALAQARHARVIVGCEMRFSTFAETFRNALREGMIGRPVIGSVIDHVASGYSFYLRDLRMRAWGRGLQTQKGIHTLDMINDFVDADPARVYASGGLDFFGGRPEAAGRHCRDCAKAKECPYSFYTIASPTWIKGGPREKGDHAFDHCVFQPDTDAPDNMQIQIDYANNFRCAYTAVYFAPQYAREFVFWGTKGSLRGMFGPGPDVSIAFAPFTAKSKAEWTPLPVPPGAGNHGGADERFINAIVEATEAKAEIRPNAWDGRAAVAIAEAAQRSMESHEAIAIPPPAR